MKKRQLKKVCNRFPRLEPLILAIASSDDKEIGERLQQRITEVKIQNLDPGVKPQFTDHQFVTKFRGDTPDTDMIHHETTDHIVVLVDKGTEHELSIEGYELVNDVTGETFANAGKPLREAISQFTDFDYIMIVAKTTRWSVERIYTEELECGYSESRCGNPESEYHIEIYEPTQKWIKGPDGVHRDPNTPEGAFNGIRGVEALLKLRT